MTKFNKYLPVLASLSSSVRVSYNDKTGSLEIYGSPESRGEILSYFADLEDSLASTQVNTITIVPATPIPSNNDNKLWKFLYDKAKRWIMINYINHRHKLQTDTLRINSELEKGCPCGKKFLRALKTIGLNPDNPEKVYSQGIFGWHGTRTEQGVAGIAHNNFDPSRRSGQAYGPGEYCAKKPDYSQNSYWGNTNTLFVVFILKNNPCYTENEHYVVNNPTHGNEMYMVPILIATFNQQTPIAITCNNVSHQRTDVITWEWKADNQWEAYGVGQDFPENLQISIEDSFQKYKTHVGASTVALSLKRLNDKNTENYLIDFKSKNQTNSKTKFVREIRRKENDVIRW